MSAVAQVFFFEELLRFFEPGETPGAVLVIESVQYLPALRSRFPDADLFAVVSDRDAATAPETEGLGVKWTILDYREEVLPFPRQPALLLPQMSIVPFLPTAAQWLKPARTDAAPLIILVGSV